MIKNKAFLWSLVVFVASCAIGIAIVVQSVRLEAESHRRDTLRTSTFYIQRLHDMLDKSATGAYLLAAILHTSHGKVENFEKIAPEISKLSGGVKAVELVPGGVVKYVWPLGPNRQAIGLDLFRIPTQRRYAVMTQVVRHLLIAGPFPLVQGGSGLCAKYPVFLTDSHGHDTFWGFTETVVLVDDLLNECGIDSVRRQGLDYEIYRAGDKVASSKTGRLTDPASETVDIAGSMWSLGVQPRAGWYSVTTRNVGVVIVLVVSALLAVLANYLIGRPAALAREVAARTADLVEANSRLAERITERDIAQQGLAESEGRHRRLVELAPMGIVMVSPAGQFLSVNRTLVNMLGYSEDELLSMRFQDITEVEGQGVDVVGQEAMQRMADGSVDGVHLEKRYVCKDGRLVNVDITAAAVRDEHGNLLHTVSLIQDVTEKLNMEATLRQSQKMQAIGTLAGGIAHDFNNVLAVIRGNAQLLSALELEEPYARDYVESIERSSERAHDLVRQILTFSRSEETPRSPRLLRPMLEDALQLLRSTLKSSVHIEAGFEDTDLVVSATPSEIHRLMMNLGSNSEAALAGEPGRFSVSLRRTKAAIGGVEPTQCAQIRVTDSGTGMDQAVAGRIFEPFFSTKPVGHGTGMGLSIVHGIVTSLGGSIRLESEPGRGTTFEILLPISDQPAEDVAPTSSGEAISCEGARILFIDDEPDLVFLGKRILCRHGHSVEGFTDPDLALNRLESDPAAFDIVCCDLTMPGIFGIDVAVKARDIRPGLPVLLMSGFVRPEDAERAASLGLDEIVTKPGMMDALPRLVQESLERHLTGAFKA